MAKGNHQFDGSQKFGVTQDMQGTMQQMMQSLLNNVRGGNKGQGPGGGAGGAGQGGFGGDGSVMQGFAQRNMPVFGPARLEFGHSALAYGEVHSGSGRSRGKRNNTVETSLGSTNTIDGSQSSIEKDAVPLKYKEAVKKYFSEELTK